MPAPGEARPAPAASGEVGLGYAHLVQLDFSRNELQMTGTEWADWPPYVLVLYSARINPSGLYGGYEQAKIFTGHFLRWDLTGGKPVPIYSSPDDELLDYLTNLGDQGPLPGFWAAYYVAATRAWTAEKGNDAQIVGYTMPTSPWMTGRFGGTATAGKLLDLNGLTSGTGYGFVAKMLGFAPEARVTQHLLIQGRQPLEKPLR